MARSFFVAVAAALLVAGAPAARAADADDVVVKGRPVSQWIAQLSERDAKARIAAAEALCEAGAAAKPAIPALVKALRDDDDAVKERARTALGGIGAPAVPALTEALGDGAPPVRV